MFSTCIMCYEEEDEGCVNCEQHLHTILLTQLITLDSVCTVVRIACTHHNDSKHISTHMHSHRHTCR